MLWENSLPVFVIEHGVATAKSRQKLPYTTLEFICFCGKQLRGSLINELDPRVVAHTPDIDVMFQNQLPNGSQNLGALLWTERDDGFCALRHRMMYRDRLPLRM